MTSFTRQYIVSCNEEFREILIAELSAIGFDSFQEMDSGFIAHSQATIDTAELDEIINRYKESADLSLNVEDVEQVNWNKKWEESYSPISIANKLLVRASFHEPESRYPLEIIVNPKMSFGTGHHETTSLMLEAQLNIDHKNKKVLDAGCGTGILTILAGKLGAKELVAYDNDTWVKDNIEENFKINNTSAEILIGTIDSLNLATDFDIILANINKNILLHDIPYYAANLKEGGDLLLSGFYYTDLEDLKDIATENHLNFVNYLQKNNWLMARFSKES